MADSGGKEQTAFLDVDRIIHEPARFVILAHLYVLESADFIFIMRQTGLTQGNLSSHMNKLEDAGYIKIEKDYVGRKPHTMLSLTKQGRSAFKEYRQRVKATLDDLPE